MVMPYSNNKHLKREKTAKKKLQKFYVHDGGKKKA